MSRFFINFLAQSIVPINNNNVYLIVLQTLEKKMYSMFIQSVQVLKKSFILIVDGDNVY